jgi:hypothetical protein
LLPSPSQSASAHNESELLLAQRAEARRLEAIEGFTQHYAQHICEDHLLKSCSPCLAKHLIPYTISEEAVQVSAASDSLDNLMRSFGGDRFGLEVPRAVSVSSSGAPPTASKAEEAAQLKAFLMDGDLDLIMQKADWESEAGWVLPSGDFTNQQTFAFHFWKLIHSYFPKRTVITTKKIPIKLSRNQATI